MKIAILFSMIGLCYCAFSPKLEAANTTLEGDSPTENAADGTVEVYPRTQGTVRVSGHGFINDTQTQISVDFDAIQDDAGNTTGFFSFCDVNDGVCFNDAQFEDLLVDGKTADFTGSTLLADGTRAHFRVKAADGRLDRRDKIQASIHVESGLIVANFVDTLQVFIIPLYAPP